MKTAVVFSTDRGTVSGLNFPFTRYSLTTKNIKKVLRKDVDIDIDVDAYDLIVCVGSESTQFFTGLRSVMDVSGKCLKNKFIPLINPAITAFRPELTDVVEISIQNINDYVAGKKKNVQISSNLYEGISDKEECKEYLREILESDSNYVALDSETTCLDPLEGGVLGISLCYKKNFGVYISADCLDEEAIKLLQDICNTRTIVFHNSKFDMKWLELQLGLSFPSWEDTMLIHYCGNETPGTHGLKSLAIRYTEFPYYEQEQNEWIDKFCREHKIKKGEFRWEWIPFEIMSKYAAMDAVVTYHIFHSFRKALKNTKVYDEILKPANLFLMDMESYGVPFSFDRLSLAQKLLRRHVNALREKLRSIPEIQKYEETTGKEFNPNSTLQLGKVLFDICGLKSVKTTPKGGRSTDVEVLEELSSEHEVPKIVLEFRKKVKILTGYVDKLLIALNHDNRLRTNFNLHTTRSGRLSSSGKLNMQTIPRDDPIIKGCIAARPGHKIVSADLVTAEMYVAAVLSKDENLMDVFRRKENFHSSIAKQCFNLDCEISEVSEKYRDFRQIAKAISFGILYGAGPAKISETIEKEGVSCTQDQAKGYIDDYFSSFPNLRKWISDAKKRIVRDGFIYSHFGRKRRLPEAKSDNATLRAKGTLSGVNFLVQSPASDINLLAAIELNNIRRERIIALVHDSILAEVPENEVEAYSKCLVSCMQRDRGISIPGCPIGVDIEVGDDYSFGKWDTYVQKLSEI